MFLTSGDRPSFSPNAQTKSLSARIDAVIDTALAQQRVVGAVVLAAKDGEIVYARAAGFADREAGRAITPDTLFRLSSVSKVYVSVAAMVLVEQGRLALDAPVTDWLPDFRPASPDGSVSDITVRHLLSHMAGLSYGFLEPADGPYHRAGISDGMDIADVTLEENVRRIAAVPLLFAPGTSWNYSLATDVIGLVIERATDLPLAEAVRTLVMEPLGLTDTGFAVADPDRLAAGYVDDGAAPRRMADVEIIPLPFIEGSEGLRMSLARAFDENAFASGGAGMVGSAGDLLAVLEALRKGGAPLLSPSGVEAMATDQTQGIDLLPWAGRGFGLGFTVLRDPVAANSPEPIGTWRMGGAYGHSWFVDLVNGLTVVSFTNAGLEGQSPGGRFPDGLTRAIYG
ncbi:serine hydrolase [Azospirillum melinis]|uniref:Serine hydrolase n=1 Tax=Azospirillum melinis TaxID=328839 RepID=A0ABX2KL49_9PROT|nr:serine hydrolase domain-containing protein [Azospirillum melinis]MBP2305800.1 CubicO group peptidase (beta-lactamase class C family) [Azospirillum melinis]NUB04350.1 serine hydrolase [Azospirillum melinis]